MRVGHQRARHGDGQPHRVFHLGDRLRLDQVFTPDREGHWLVANNISCLVMWRFGAAKALARQRGEHRIGQVFPWLFAHAIQPDENSALLKPGLRQVFSGGFGQPDDLAFGPTVGFENLAGNHGYLCGC